LAVVLTVTVDAVAMKIAEVEPAATVTEGGTDNKGLLTDRTTVVPPLGASSPKVTTQVLFAPEVREPALQLKPVNVVEACKPSEKFTVPPAIMAVRVALPSLVSVDTDAGKLADAAPAATVTEAGMPAKGLLLERATRAPPTGAGLFKVTVQFPTEFEPRAVGLQLKPVSAVATCRPSE
jgi:hypothetical protein